MPRGRHRQAPPLHRLLVPSAIAGFAFLCAVASPFTSDPTALRLLTLLAAVCAVTGAVLLRVWDRSAGLRVGEIKAARASAEWEADARASENEAELREAREVRGKLERRLRSRRAELARLRTEHAALLRRYANAETERANALEGRRKLAIAAAEPVKELTTGAADHRSSAGAPTALTYLQADRALSNLKRAASRQREQLAEQRRQTGAGEGANGSGQPAGFDFFGATQPPPAQQPSPTQQSPSAQQPPLAPASQDAEAQPPASAPVRSRQVASKVIDVAE